MGIPLETYCMYLRKSRADLDAEAKGECETLSRHESSLSSLAKLQNISISHIYREIVSGETISSRPVLQQLLKEIVEGKWNGVLVMEIERLARGNTKDQGIIAEAFQLSHTKIITPLKTYLPDNEFDEEYFEFELFMSRREYKTINRRIQRGRIASIKEGRYISPTPPYGYRRIKIENDKGYTLSPIPSEAAAIKMIFLWYVYGDCHPIGMQEIARRLTDMDIKPAKSDIWSRYSIKTILKNPVYIGKLRWQYRKEITSLCDGAKKKTRVKSAEGDYMLVDGLHPAIIEEALYLEAQKIMNSKRRLPITLNTTLKNPLSGILFCGICGRTLTRIAATQNKPELLRCPNNCCNKNCVKLELVEQKLLSFMEKHIKQYSWNLSHLMSPTNITEFHHLHNDTVDIYNTMLKSLSHQQEKICELAELGVYSTEEFSLRSQKISEKVKKIQEKKADFTSTPLPLCPVQDVPSFIQFYHSLSSAEQKNSLWKKLLDRAEYYNIESNVSMQKSYDDFELIIYPKIPQS